MRSLATLISILTLGATVACAELVPVDVDPIPFRTAALKVTSSQGEVSYSPETLETLGTFSLTTITPWRDAPAEFVGVRLRDVLTAHGLDQETSIRVIAENDYAVELYSEAWMTMDALIATRVDGKAHSRRARGPLQIVFPMTDQPELGQGANQRYWVWMAAAIEVQN